MTRPATERRRRHPATLRSQVGEDVKRQIRDRRRPTSMGKPRPTDAAPMGLRLRAAETCRPTRESAYPNRDCRPDPRFTRNTATPRRRRHPDRPEPPRATDPATRCNTATRPKPRQAPTPDAQTPSATDAPKPAPDRATMPPERRKADHPEGWTAPRLDFP